QGRASFSFILAAILAAIEPAAPGRHRYPLASRPPEPGEPPPVDAPSIETLAEGQVHLASLRPVSEDDRLRASAEVEPGSVTYQAELRELLAWTFLGSLARGHPGVHEDIAVLAADGGKS